MNKPLVRHSGDLPSPYLLAAVCLFTSCWKRSGGRSGSQ